MGITSDGIAAAPEVTPRQRFAALAVPATLLIVALGPGTFGSGRGVWAQSVGWLLMVIWTWHGMGSLRRLPTGVRVLATVGAGLLATILFVQVLTGAQAAAKGQWLQSELPWLWLVPWGRLRVVAAVAVSPWVIAGLARSLRRAIERGCGGTLVVGGSCVLLLVLVIAGVEAVARQGRPAMPLGHHNLLALIVVPSTVVLIAGVANRGAARGHGRQRWLLGSLAGSGVVMALATGSLAGAVGLVTGTATALLCSARSDERRRGTQAAVLLVAALTSAVGLTQWQRLADVARGVDASTAARAAYAQAAVEAFGQRSWFGWGLANGATALARLLPPRPAVVEPGQVVADAHSLWLDLLMELGLLGSTLALAPVALIVLGSARRSWIGRAGCTERAALAGWVALLTMSLVAGWFDVGAIWWLAAALLAGQIAGRPLADPTEGRKRLWLSALFLPWLAVIAAPDLIARQSAVAWARHEPAGTAVARVELWGTSLDRLRRALHEPDARRASSLARSAAALADGQWLHWTIAGDLELRLGNRERAFAMLERACDLEPEVPFAAFLLARAGQGPAAAAALARALLAEPRLAAAEGLPPERLAEAVRRLETLDGVALGWRAAIAESLATQLEQPMAHGRSAGDDGELGVLSLKVDDLAETSLSLFLERRQPVPLGVPMAELRLRDVALWEIEPATRLSDTDPAIWRDGCRLSAP